MDEHRGGTAELAMGHQPNRHGTGSAGQSLHFDPALIGPHAEGTVGAARGEVGIHPAWRESRVMAQDAAGPIDIQRLQRRLVIQVDDDMGHAGVDGIAIEWLSRDVEPQGRALAVLSVTDGVTVNDLSVYTVIEQWTLSRTLDTLEKQGLVRREAGDTDSRVRKTRKRWSKLASAANKPIC